MPPEEVRSGAPVVSSATGPSSPPPTAGSPAEEAVHGSVDYLDFLREVHAQLRPDLYLELGVRHGRSLALARCPAIGVDPAPDVSEPFRPDTRVLETTSDNFFWEQAADVIREAPDLVFIDGMHLFEYALRDFMHVERLASPTTLVVIDDIYPNHPLQAARKRATRVWSGDVWKLHLCLSEARPDLLLLPLDTRPTGLLLVAGLRPRNRVLWERYNPLVNRYRNQTPQEPPPSVIQRQGALPPPSEQVDALCRTLRELRQARPDAARVGQALAQIRRPAPPSS
jgi:hypothetical protein